MLKVPFKVKGLAPESTKPTLKFANASPQEQRGKSWAAFTPCDEHRLISHLVTTFDSSSAPEPFLDSAAYQRLQKTIKK